MVWEKFFEKKNNTYPNEKSKDFYKFYVNTKYYTLLQLKKNCCYSLYTGPNKTTATVLQMQLFVYISL